jgi:hypothetical protein
VHHLPLVHNDNCVSFEGMSLQLPSDELRHHYVRTNVRVHRYVWASFTGHASWPLTTPRGTRTITKKVLRAAA